MGGEGKMTGKPLTRGQAAGVREESVGENTGETGSRTDSHGTVPQRSGV